MCAPERAELHSALPPLIRDRSVYTRAPSQSGTGLAAPSRIGQSVNVDLNSRTKRVSEFGSPSS